MENGCYHDEETHYEAWPDGGSIEVCDVCGMSRHHWEFGESPWTMVKNIAEARSRLEEEIRKMRDSVEKTIVRICPVHRLACGFTVTGCKRSTEIPLSWLSDELQEEFSRNSTPRKKKVDLCKYYPRHVNEGPVCYAGSEVTSTPCSDEYAKTCQWFLEEDKRSNI